MVLLCRVHDDRTELRHWVLENRRICIYLATFQLVVSLVALLQHVYSMAVSGVILDCVFNATNPANISILMRIDAIIFDVGLFYELWKLPTCVAVELDGGYGRFLWCLLHLITLCMFLAVTVSSDVPRLCTLWPLLLQQSMYGIGMLILSFAGLPRLVPVVFGGLLSEHSLFLPILVYLVGVSLNFFFLYVLWHYYWHVETEHKLRTLMLRNGLSTTNGPDRTCVVTVGGVGANGVHRHPALGPTDLNVLYPKHARVISEQS